MRRLRVIKIIELLVLSIILASPVSVFASEPTDEPNDTPVEQETVQTTDSQQSEQQTSETPASEHQEQPEQTEEYSGGEEQPSNIQTITVPIRRRRPEVVSIVLPTVQEPSPFDFLMDPQELIYLTDAAKYGGGKVEKDATLLFRNRTGDYDFSSYSDKLTIKNESNVPVRITVEATISGTDGINIVSSPNFGDSTGCDMYFALVDNKGQEIPLSDDWRIVAYASLAASPEANYTYYIDEETGNYACVFNPVGGFDEYSFGLHGKCNPNGEWKDVDINPRVSLTWEVEPVLTEEEIEEILQEIYEPVTEDEKEETTSDEQSQTTTNDETESQETTSEENNEPDSGDNPVDNPESETETTENTESSETTSQESELSTESPLESPSESPSEPTD